MTVAGPTPVAERDRVIQHRGPSATAVPGTFSQPRPISDMTLRDKSAKTVSRQVPLISEMILRDKSAKTVSHPIPMKVISSRNPTSSNASIVARRVPNHAAVILRGSAWSLEPPTTNWE